MIKHGKEEKDFPESYNPFATVELPDETAVGKKTKEIQILPLECLERFKEVALGYNPDGTLAYHYGPALVISHFKKDWRKALWHSCRAPYFCNTASE